MSKTESIAILAATLSAEAHFIQSSKKLRPALYAVPSPEQIAADASALRRIGASVKRWAERACNGEGHSERLPGSALGKFSWVWDETDQAAMDRADKRAMVKASEIAARYGATVEIGGDPRGYVLRLKLKSGRRNGFGEGWGIA